MQYCFLLSYASIDRKNLETDLVLAFFKDLQRKVSDFGWPDGGFLDATGIETGQRWELRLVDALARSRILVPLCSRNYFRSAYCGREWSVFESRYKASPSGNQDGQRYILPVQWVPIPDQLKRASEIQSMHHSYPDIYKREGLCYLMGTPKYRDEYQEFLHTFSKQVAAAADALAGIEVWPVPALMDVVPAFPAEAANAATQVVKKSEPDDIALSVAHTSGSSESQQQTSVVPASPPEPRPSPVGEQTLHGSRTLPRSDSGLHWYKRLRPGVLLWSGVAIWFVSNLLSLLGSSSIVVTAVYERYGPEFLHMTQWIMSRIVTAGFIAGYSLPFAAFVLWVRQLLMPRTTRMACIVFICLIAAVALTANVNISLHRTGLTSVVNKQVRESIDVFTNEIIARQQRKAGPAQGSFLYSPDLTDTREHVWTNALGDSGGACFDEHEREVPKVHEPSSAGVGRYRAQPRRRRLEVLGRWRENRD